MSAFVGSDSMKYPLTPLQEGMLLHSVSEPGVGMYFNQVVYNMEDIDIEAMRAAWQALLDRYEILRSSFHWENSKTPYQRVESEVIVPFHIEDWSHLERVESQKKLREYLGTEKQNGFDFTVAPLIKVTLAKITSNEWLYIFSHHHLILDGWSKNEINSELRKYYEASKKGGSISLPSPIQFRNYLEYLQKRDRATDQDFWQTYLSSVHETRRLPGERSGKAWKQYRISFGEWSLQLTSEKKEAVLLAARECRVTLNSLVIGAWGILMSRYAEQNDIIFGMLVSGRPNDMPGIEKMVGMFLNAIPVRVKINNDQTFREWIQLIQRDQSSLRMHEHTPLRDIQEFCGLSTGKPLYECIVVNTNTVAIPQSIDETSPRKSGVNRAFASNVQQNVPLHLDLETVGENLTFKMTYDARRFSQESIVRVMEHYSILLEHIIQGLDTKLGDISMLSQKERHIVTTSWNQTEIILPDEIRGLHNLFERTAERYPQRIAAAYGDQTIRYSDLDKESSKVALSLIRLGLVGTIVGISIRRSIDAAIGILGILRAGCAYVPLDPMYPENRLSYMIEDSGASTILVNDSSRSFGDTIKVLEIKDLIANADEGSASLLAANVNRESLAYILYTSGSTGLPKGIGVPHRVPINRLLTEPIPVGNDESFCAKTSLSFVDSIWEMFSAWMHGSKVTFIPEEVVPDIENFIGAIEASMATRLVLVPSLLRAILYSGIDLSERLGCIKHWISSGEKLQEDLSTEFSKRFPKATLINIYGTSEIWDATAYISTAGSVMSGEIPVGKPMGNVQCFIVDESMQPMPIGINGKLMVGGMGVADCYWGREELTKEKFVTNPFGGGNLYKTGDIARWLPDGTIELVGREDTQIKIRGFRIEIEEIENTLRTNKNILDAAVWVSEGDSLSAGLVCPDVIPEASELHIFAQRFLPDYMVPRIWYLIDSIPKGPNGKVDRQSLRSCAGNNIIKQSAEPDGSISEAKVSEYQQMVRDAWSQILGLKLNLNDNVFHNGAHSLTATKAAIAIGKKLEIKIPLKVIFENPTALALASWLEEYGDKLVGAKEMPTILKKTRGKEEPLSYNQKRLWFLDQLNPSSIAYTVPNRFTLQGSVDAHALEETLKLLISRHEILRTTFAAKEGIPYQVIHDQIDFNLEFEDISYYTGRDLTIKVEEKASEFIRRPWSLAEGPLIRAKLIKSNQEKCTVLLAMHHIITDGHSMGLIANEIEKGYTAFCQKKVPVLPAVDLQFADFSRWEAEWLQGQISSKHIDYWKNRLEDISDLSLPLDFSRPKADQNHVATVELELGLDVKKRLEVLAMETESTEFMVLLTGFQVFLALVSGQDEIYVGTPVSNRDRPEIQRTLGFFVNTIVHGLKLNRNETFKETLKRVRRGVVNDLEYSSVPYDLIVDELKPVREANKNPLFQVMYVHQKVSSGLTLGSMEISQESRKDVSDFDLLLSTSSSAEKLVCTLQYRTSLFRAETLVLFKRILEQVLIEMAFSSESTIAEADFTDQTEKEMILQWGQPKPISTKAIHVCDWVESGAQAYPERIACEDDNKSITYADLDCLCESFSQYLLNKYNNEETVTGVCVSKSVDVLVALFGTLKAGKTVMAIDPEYPDERIKLMLEEASCSTIVVDEETRLRLLALDTSLNLISVNEMHGFIAGDNAMMAPKPSIAPIAYVSFTSGTTGRPKGVLIDHKNIIATVEAQVENFDIHPDSRVLQVLSIGFDAGLAEIFRSISAGATLVLANRNDLLAGPGFIKLLRDKRISVAAIPPVMLGALPETSPDELPELKTVITGGEACPIHVARRWASNRSLVLGYGTTETANGSLFTKSWDLEKKPPLGKPLPNTSVYVLNEKKRICAVGMPGYIYIGGLGVSRGYMNKPELTSEVFITDPFSSDPTSRMYSTGDRGRWLRDGTVEFLGRQDSQVKIRGHRIELGEIIETIQQHPSVDDCIIIQQKDSNIQRLFAYVTGNKLKSSDANKELRNFLKSKLPDYMVPATFICLKKIPVTSSGKVDYKSLPKPTLSLLADDSSYVAPSSDVEIKIASIWCKVLGLERVSRDANFFELGGDSILSVQVVAQATSSGIPITVKDIFDYQTVALLAESSINSTLVDIDQSPVVGPVKFTPIQQWHLSNSGAVYSDYSHSMIVPLNTSWISGDIVPNAITSLWDHHDALRASYEIDTTGVWHQRIQSLGKGPSIIKHDISSLGLVEQSDYITSTIKEAASKLDITSSQISVVLIFQRRSQTSFAAILIHHLVTDIVSWKVIIEDFQYCLRCFSNQQVPQLPKKTTSYGDWADLLDLYSRSQGIQDEVSFWTSTARSSVNSLPIENNVSSDLNSDSKTYELKLGKQHTKALLASVSLSESCTVQLALLTAIGSAFYEWSGNPQILIDVEGHGREEAIFSDINLSRTVGWFTSFYPLLLQFSSSFDDISGHLNDVTEALNTIPNKGLGYGVIKYLFPDDDVRMQIKNMPQSQIAFNYIGINSSKKPERAPSNDDLSSLNIGQIWHHQSPAKNRLHTFEILAAIAGDELILRLSYNKNQYSDATVATICSLFEAHLLRLVGSLSNGI
ncbi:amino acid adenylation domain-containing protein [Cyanobium sp. Aljojuca 7D2]|uniref:non-ribosomal peptide synthetase n=1 Tax=Cyanobium sp. Aljojuca 7D2 TaxID=2823698 RepID=UPI0020CB848C|nr:non-ribosomal peptide synthetase [Cyanobium sp. Aljojuca 7D2]MCP9892153.1 amino acid adenylation domain-containing protein [Cyanobium sp. Aljojuca 7D2]